MLRQRLKDETWDLHQKAEAAMDLMNPKMDSNGYLRILKSLYSFYAAIEPQLKTSSVGEFYDGREKLPWIVQDLKALGLSDRDILAIPKISVADLKLDLPALWGSLYVIEGSMLGGQMIMKYQSKTLGLDENSGMRFFAGSGVETGRKWQETIAKLNEISDEQTDDAVISTAKWTFQKMMDAIELQRAS